MSGVAVPPGVTVFCDPTLAPAMRGVERVSRARYGAPLGVLTAPAASMLAQIQRHTRNDVLFTLSSAMDQAVQMQLVKPETRVNGWCNTLVLAALADRVSPPANQAALLAMLGAAKIAVTDDTPAASLDGRAVLARNGLTAGQVMGAANTGDVAFLVTTGAADIGLVYLTDVRADPRLKVVATLDANPEWVNYSGAVNAAAVSPNAQNVLNLLRGEAGGRLRDAGLQVPA